MDKLDVVLHAGVLVGVGLGIFMGLGAVSNLETSLETFWLAPGVDPGSVEASGRFLEDDILSSLFFLRFMSNWSLFCSAWLGCSLISFFFLVSWMTSVALYLSTLLWKSSWCSNMVVHPPCLVGEVLWTMLVPGADVDGAGPAGMLVGTAPSSTGISSFLPCGTILFSNKHQGSAPVGILACRFGGVPGDDDDEDAGTFFRSWSLAFLLASSVFFLDLSSLSSLSSMV